MYEAFWFLSQVTLLTESVTKQMNFRLVQLVVLAITMGAVVAAPAPAPVEKEASNGPFGNADW